MKNVWNDFGYLNTDYYISCFHRLNLLCAFRYDYLTFKFKYIVAI